MLHIFWRRRNNIDTFFFVSTIHKKYSTFFVGNFFSLDGHLSVVRDDSWCKIPTHELIFDGMSMFCCQIAQLDASQRPIGHVQTPIEQRDVIGRRPTGNQVLSSHNWNFVDFWRVEQRSLGWLQELWNPSWWSRKTNQKRQSMAKHHAMLVRMVRFYPHRFSNAIGVPGM